MAEARKLLARAFCAALLVFVGVMFFGAGQAQALSSKYVGTYECVVGDLDSWGGTTPVKNPGYTLSLKITRVRGSKVKFTFQQARFYGTTGSFVSDSKPVTVKLKKNRTANFTFKTLNGSKGKGSIKLVSKNKVKLRLYTPPKTTKERIPPTTGWKYKTLKRV